MANQENEVSGTGYICKHVGKLANIVSETKTFLNLRENILICFLGCFCNNVS